jgi:uncharacterized membrane protein YheB (UPF0754 family)
MAKLNEEALKIIKEEVLRETIKQVASEVIEEQLRGTLAQWLASKIPGSSAQLMDKAIDDLSAEELAQAFNVDEFIAAVKSNTEKILDNNQENFSNVISRYVTAVMEKAIEVSMSELKPD